MSSIKLSQLLIFTRQFAAMTNSQLQLSFILQNLAKETPHRKMRETIQFILDDILHGVDLGNAFAKFPNVFNDVYVNVIRAGLESGMLGNALSQIARYLEVADIAGIPARTATARAHIIDVGIDLHAEIIELFIRHSIFK